MGFSKKEAGEMSKNISNDISLEQRIKLSLKNSINNKFHIIEISNTKIYRYFVHRHKKQLTPFPCL